MNIGLDIDGVLTDIYQFQIKYGKDFFKKYYNLEIVYENALELEEMFGCNEFQAKSFWYRYIHLYATKYEARINADLFTKNIYNNGGKIYIITSRVFANKDNLLGKQMRKYVEKFLLNNNIKYEEIIYCDEDKTDAIKRYNIKYMIEDSKKNIEILSKITKVLCMDTPYNKDINLDNVIRINDFDQASEYLCQVLKKEEKHIKDPITVMSNIPSIDKIWTRQYNFNQTTVEKQKIKVLDYLKNNTKGNEKSLAIRYLDSKMSFEELYKRVDSYAKSLAKSGIKENDVITICMPNTPEGVIAFLAANQIGAVANMLHPLSSPEEIKLSLLNSNSKYMVMMDFCYESIKNIISKTNVKKISVVSAKDSAAYPIKGLLIADGILEKIKLQKELYALKITNKNTKDKIIHLSNLKRINKISNKLEQIPYGKNSDILYVKFSDEEKYGKDFKDKYESSYKENMPAVYLSTGGTTGIPKLTVLTNEAITTNTEQLKYTIPSYKKGDELLAITPIFHGFGLVDSVLTALNVNMSVDLHPNFNNKLFSRAIIKNKPTLILGVPTLYQKMILDKKYNGKDLSHLKVLISGGDKMPDSLRKDINNWKKQHNAENKLFSGIGLTEATAAIAFTGLNSIHEDSVGFPLPLNNIKVIDENGNELSYNEPGELCISGPTLMKEYLNKGEETLDAIREDENGRLWLHTGDICKIEENGEITFIDRNKGVIIVSGVNVYRNSIEPVVEGLKEVSACAVIGIPHRYKMNVVKAFVVLQDGIELTDDLKHEIMTKANSELNTYQKLYDIEQIDSLPLTKLNKVNYNVLIQKEAEKSKVKQKV